MNAAIYLRVSSTDGRQDEAHQEPDCRRVAVARDWAVAPGHVFAERESGAKRRPIWEACMESARKGEVGAVIVWSLDRIGRERVKVASDLGRLLAWNCRVVSVQDPWIDSADTVTRPLLIQVLAWVAQQQRDRLIAATRSGLARARAAGTILGRRRRVPEDMALALGLAFQRGGWPAAREVPGVGGYARSTIRSTAEREADRLSRNP